MKKLFSTLATLLLLSMTSQAQVIINEILYNVPGANENEEFIELYNAGGSAVNLQGYTFTQGVTLTIGSGESIPAGGYYVIGFNAAAFQAAYGFAADTVYTGGLSNTGEDITLYDGSGNLVDSVDYKTTAPWPTLANGQGRSLQLCDPMTDNGLGSNWGTNNTAVGVNGSSGTDSLYATPGMMNQCVGVVPPPPLSSYPVYTFGQVSGVNANGVADSVGVRCQLRGIAHCVDLRGGAGYDFPLANSNNTGGIRVFSFADMDGYTLQAGDSLHVWGEIIQFNGLLQLEPDSILVVSQGNATATPMTVTTLTEATENKLVTLYNMHVVDTAAWTGTGSGFNVLITDGSADTTLVRIDADVNLFSQPAPLGNFSITGWVGQFDSSNPYTSGYQLFPCGMSMLTGTTELEGNSNQFLVYPNPSSSVLNVQTDLEIQNVLVYNALGQIVISVNNINTNTTQINTRALENGVYVIAIMTDKKVMTQQFQVIR